MRMGNGHVMHTLPKWKQRAFGPKATLNTFSHRTPMTIGPSSVDMSLWARCKLSLCVYVQKGTLCIALRRMDCMGSFGGRVFQSWSLCTCGVCGLFSLLYYSLFRFICFWIFIWSLFTPFSRMDFYSEQYCTLCLPCMCVLAWFVLRWNENLFRGTMYMYVDSPECDTVCRP